MAPPDRMASERTEAPADLVRRWAFALRFARPFHYRPLFTAPTRPIRARSPLSG